MKKLSGNIRFYILCISLFVSAGIYLFVMSTVGSGIRQLTKLDEWYALVAVGYLYIVLLISPLLQAFPFFPFRGAIVKSLSLRFQYFFTYREEKRKCLIDKCKLVAYNKCKLVAFT